MQSLGIRDCSALPLVNLAFAFPLPNVHLNEWLSNAPAFILTHLYNAARLSVYPGIITLRFGRQRLLRKCTIPPNALSIAHLEPSCRRTHFQMHVFLRNVKDDGLFPIILLQRDTFPTACIYCQYGILKISIRVCVSKALGVWTLQTVVATKWVPELGSDIVTSTKPIQLMLILQANKGALYCTR